MKNKLHFHYKIIIITLILLSLLFFYYLNCNKSYTIIFGRVIYSKYWKNKFGNRNDLDEIYTTNEINLICDEKENFIDEQGYDNYINYFPHKTNQSTIINSFKFINFNIFDDEKNISIN